MMEKYVDWEPEKDNCSTTVNSSDDPIGASDCIADKSSLLLEAEEVNLPLSNLSGNFAPSSAVSDLPLALACTGDRSSGATSPKVSTYCRKWDLAAEGVYVPTSAACEYLCEGKDLEHWLSKHSADLQGSLKEEGENFIILVESLDGENLPPLLSQVLPFQCERCGRSFRDTHQLEDHKLKYATGCSYWCPVCGKEFFRSANLRMHKLIHSSDRPHKCPECGKGFIRTADVWKHLQRMHKIDRSSIVLGDANVKNPWFVLNQSQGQRFNSGQLGSAARNPGKDGSEPYQCLVCCKAFSNANSLSKHKVVHKTEKPYQCDQCSMAFVQQVRLKRHYQTHTGERPFSCKECGKAFTRLASLQRHWRIHTGEKPYSCAYCAQSFAELGTLRRHERVHEVVQS